MLEDVLSCPPVPSHRVDALHITMATIKWNCGNSYNQNSGIVTFTNHS